MAQIFANGARAALSAGIAAGDTTLTIASGGALFPIANTDAGAVGGSTDWYKVVLDDGTNFEIVYIRTHTSASTSFTNVLRGQEGTAARAFAAGSVLGVRVTAEDMRVSIGRELLTANRTYYVRADGSDTNTGLANTAGAAFLTIQKAIDVIAATLDIATYTVTIQCGAGARTASTTLKQLQVTGGSVSIVGDETTPANCTITTTSASCFTASDFAGPYTLAGFKLSTVTSGTGISASGKAAVVRFKNLDFGACASAHIQAHAHSLVEASGNYKISGAAPWHCSGFTGGAVTIQVRTVTITGTPAFSYTFALAQTGGIVTLYNNTYSGAATGPRYNAATNAVINTGGGGATALPGDTAGSTATGGQYA